MSITRENFLVPFMCYGSTIATYSTPCTLPALLLVSTFNTRTTRKVFFIFYSVFDFHGVVDLIRAYLLNFHVMKNDLLSCLPQKRTLHAFAVIVKRAVPNHDDFTNFYYFSMNSSDVIKANGLR